MSDKKIIIGSDHAGFNLKQKIKDYLTNSGYIVVDAGADSVEQTDYPLIAKSVACSVSNSEYQRGILICGTGIGMSICANKVKGIRAVVCSDTTSARFSREHNNTNILCLGERIIGEYLAKDICDIWLNTEFKGNRHLKRLKMIEE